MAYNKVEKTLQLTPAFLQKIKYTLFADSFLFSDDLTPDEHRADNKKLKMK